MNLHKIVLALGLAAVFTACDKKEKQEQVNQDPAVSDKPAELVLKPTPVFNENNAYDYIAKQVSFGPRVPNSEAHVKCGNWLVSTLKSAGLEVIQQDFTTTAFNGKKLVCRNIIASYNPQAGKRILLASHWDSRPFADQDTKDKNKPIDGANDGASGVGVLLEIARILSTENPKPDIGVDIIFFDAEDYGETEDYDDSQDQPGKWWCLGSQHWAANKHTPNYTAYYGILLDMVGGKNAKFAKDGTSMHYAPSVVEKVWSIAQKKGYSQFMNAHVPQIIDDHLYVNQKAGINMIDIIEYDPSDENYFSPTWHTHNDNLSNIDKNTLKAVGETVLQTLYQE